METGGFLVTVNELLGFARSEFFGMGAATLLVTWAVISSVKMWLASNRAKSDTEEALRSVVGLSTPAEFTDNFSDIDEKLQAGSRFKSTWVEFKKTLITPLDHIDEPEYRTYRATKRPHDYFDSEHVLRDIRPLWFDSENLIGLGLILTFLGLIAALIHAGLNLTASDSSGVQRVIQDLLSTAGAKFFASLGGVGGALIQGIAKRACSDKAEAHLEEFLAKLESLLPFASLEKIASEQYAHAIRQTARLEEMGSEITMAIGARLESALTGVGARFDDALKSMPSLMKIAMSGALSTTDQRIGDVTKGIDQLRTEGSNAQEILRSDLVKLLDEQIAARTSLINRVDEVKTILDESSKAMPEKVKDAVSAGMTETNDVLKNLAKGIGTTSTDALRELVGQFKEQLTGAGEQTMNQVVSQLDSLSTALNQTVGSLAQSNIEIRQTMSEMLEALKASRTEFGTTVTNTADAASKHLMDVTAGVTQALNQVIQKLDQQHQETSSALSQLVKTFADAGEDAAKNMRDSSTQASSGISDSLQKTIQLLLENAGNAGTAISKKIGEGFDAASTEMSTRANNALKASTETILESMKEVSKSLDTWNQSTIGATGAMSQVNQSLNTHKTGIEQVNAKLRDTEVAIGSSAQSLREATAPLALTTTQLASASEALKRTVNDVMNRINELGTLTDGSARSMSEAVEGLVKAWNQQASHLKLSNQQIEGAFNVVTKNLEQSLGVLHSFSTKLNDSLGSSIRDLGTIASEIADAVEGMRK